MLVVVSRDEKFVDTHSILTRTEGIKQNKSNSKETKTVFIALWTYLGGFFYRFIFFFLLFS